MSVINLALSVLSINELCLSELLFCLKKSQNLSADPCALSKCGSMSPFEMRIRKPFLNANMCALSKCRSVNPF